MMMKKERMEFFFVFQRTIFEMRMNTKTTYFNILNTKFVHGNKRSLRRRREEEVS